MDTLARLQAIFQDVFQDPRLVVTEQTTPADVERWDSLGHVQLAFVIQSELGIALDFDEFGSAKSVGDLVALIAKSAKT